MDGKSGWCEVEARPFTKHPDRRRSRPAKEGRAPSRGRGTVPPRPELHGEAGRGRLHTQGGSHLGRSGRWAARRQSGRGPATARCRRPGPQSAAWPPAWRGTRASTTAHLQGRGAGRRQGGEDSILKPGRCRRLASSSAKITTMNWNGTADCPLSPSAQHSSRLFTFHTALSQSP